MEFYGLEECKLDASGRLKLPIQFMDSFKSHGETLVLYCLPEGAIAVYPLNVWEEMRSDLSLKTENLIHQISGNLTLRRQLRRFGSMSLMLKISNQGRLSLPGPFREFASLPVGELCIVAGVELGVEIWNKAKWEAEQKLIQAHIMSKGDHQMSADLDLSQD
ncbi:MAG: hypothetical protein HRT89_25080 [Lentisphaeria bacterium]|nr:hypothetical protein [Lentisphaeria bacterium]NQZ71333.1 hypothetical protein [Lentisphaeria bacterium]